MQILQKCDKQHITKNIIYSTGIELAISGIVFFFILLSNEGSKTFHNEEVWNFLKILILIDIISSIAINFYYLHKNLSNIKNCVFFTTQFFMLFTFQFEKRGFQDRSSFYHIQDK